MLSLTIKNICKQQILLKNPVGSIGVDKEITISIDDDDLEHLSYDLRRLSDAKLITFRVKDSLKDIDYWQFGRNGPLFKSNNGIIDARDSSNTVFVEVRGAGPTTDYSFVTRKYFEDNTHSSAIKQYKLLDNNTDYVIVGNTSIDKVVEVVYSLQLPASGKQLAGNIKILYDGMVDVEFIHEYDFMGTAEVEGVSYAVAKYGVELRLYITTYHIGDDPIFVYYTKSIPRGTI